ncbi:hypothetical protein [Methanosarcina horonobensis]|nr:hypothetical protein [Methanosarcina horonobensis]
MGPAGSQEGNETSSALENTAVIIEDPVSGEFLFEMVSCNGTKYIMSRF